MSPDLIPTTYETLLRAMKERVRQAQTRAAVAVNRELLFLYWHIGHDILTSQHEQRWGAKVIDRLAKDLQQEFPTSKGFSARNLKYMRAFAEAYPEEAFVQQLAAQIPWFHHCVLLERVKDPVQRRWYIEQAAQYGWSRNVLVHQIESGLYQRQGQAVTNFEQTLRAATALGGGQDAWHLRGRGGHGRRRRLGWG